MPEDDQSQLGPGSALCRQFDQGLSAFLEGEDKPEVLAHARQCPLCRLVLADLEQIRFASHHLPPREPPARMWENIHAALEAEGIIRGPVPAWQRWLPYLGIRHSLAPAGALACMALLGITLLLFPPSLQTPGSAKRSAARGETTAVASFVPVINDELARALAEMEDAYRARERYMEPALKDAYRKSLQSLNASIEESTQHCQHHPGSALAREYLIRAYQSKAEVLAAALESPAR
jgi:hypothetical protein